MKRLICFLSLFCLLLSGCGSGPQVQAPFLRGSERQELEEKLLSGLTFYYRTENGFTSARVVLENKTKYHITDIGIYDKATRFMLLHYYDLPVNARAEEQAYTTEDWSDIGERNMILEYTIGEYSYSVQGIQVKAEEDTGENSSMTLNVTVHTDEGDRTLRNGKALEFLTGSEIEGLSSGKIYSIKPNWYYNSLAGGFDFSAEVEGLAPDKGDILARLVDENGVIRGIDTLYFTNGKAYIYFVLGYSLEPHMNYTLTFAEKS